MSSSYPVRVTAHLEPELSRWLWVVKCTLATLFTTRCPRGLFADNLGVLWWSWRVSFYSYGALGIDRYSPLRLDQGGDDPGGIAAQAPGLALPLAEGSQS